MDIRHTSSPPADPRSPARRSARYERRRADILDIAVGLINDKGVGAMTLQDVSRSLELTTTSVTYYYRYKEELVAAVFEDTLDRLGEMARSAASAETPRERVRSYVGLFFAQFEKALRGEDRPLAVLSELRTLDDGLRQQLIARYQDVFRAVRRLFGSDETSERKRLLSARAQLLNEALFWAAIWLRRYPIRDFSNVKRRLLDLLENGLDRSGDGWTLDIVDPDAGMPDDAKRDFLRVASRLINDIGYKGASVDRIVRELNITKGSFYHHLEAKDDLILACYQYDWRRLTRLQDAIDVMGEPVISRLGCALASTLTLQFDGSHPMLRTNALHAMPATVRQEPLRRFDRLAFWMSGLLVDGMTEGSIRVVDPMIAANVIISTINSAYDLRGWAAKQSRPLAVKTYADLLATGLFSTL